MGAVEKLIGNEELKRRQILAQRAHRAHGNDLLDAEHLHGADVRAIVDFRRRNEVPATVPREKRNALAFQGADYDGLRWIAKGRLDATLTRVGEAAHVIETAAADDS